MLAGIANTSARVSVILQGKSAGMTLESGPSGTDFLYNARDNRNRIRAGCQESRREVPRSEDDAFLS